MISTYVNHVKAPYAKYAGRNCPLEYANTVEG